MGRGRDLHSRIVGRMGDCILEWGHRYEFLLHLVSSDAIDVALKKRCIDSSFVRQLLLLFDSQVCAPRGLSRVHCSLLCVDLMDAL